MGLKLNLGCAMDIKQGFMNIDMFHTDPRVKIADVSKLDFVKDGAAEYVYAKDVVEHMTFEVAKRALREWSRVLKPGGTIFLQTTNIEKQFEAFKLGVWDLPTFNYMLFGGKGYVDGKTRFHDHHHCVFTPAWLTKELSNVGITVTKTHLDQIDMALRQNPRCHNLNVTLHGKKK